MVNATVLFQLLHHNYIFRARGFFVHARTQQYNARYRVMKVIMNQSINQLVYFKINCWINAD